MTKRRCPWCGGENLTLSNVSGQDPDRQFTSYHYWEDKECGYKEKTSTTEYYDHRTSKYVQCERVVLAFQKPRPPLPEDQRPAYLRKPVREKPRVETAYAESMRVLVQQEGGRFT